jgi:transcriptional regulator GlxA family with amidase domain
MLDNKIINTNVDIKVAIINIDNSLSSAILGMMDIFAIANLFCGGKNISVSIVHTKDNIKAFNTCLKLESIEIQEKGDYNLVIIPPIIDIEFSMEKDDVLSNWLHQMIQKGNHVCSVCAGAYILAQSGLLNGKKATTHWLLESKFQKEFPLIDIDIDKIIIEDGHIITTGGVSTYIDLCLYIIRKFISPDVAQRCANYLVVDTGRMSQKPYKDLIILANHNDEDIKNLIIWIKEHYYEKISIIQMAKQISTSNRTLIRRFKKATGELPNHFIQKVRVQKAKEFLINTNDSFEVITCNIGYDNASTFRRLFKEMTGLNPSEYRRNFMIK